MVPFHGKGDNHRSLADGSDYHMTKESQMNNAQLQKEFSQMNNTKVELFANDNTQFQEDHSQMNNAQFQNQGSFTNG